MKAIFSALGLLYCALLLPHPAWATSGPEDFVSSILASDFEGNQGGRNYKVIFTDGLPPTVGDCGCSMRRETFNLTASPLVVVKTWELGQTRRISSREAIVTAHFRVLATSVVTRHMIESSGLEETLFHFVAAAPPGDETVSYRVKLRKGHWFLVDPPIPRTGMQAMRQRLRQDIDIDTELMATRPQTEPGWPSWKESSEREKQQLSVLDSLDHD